MRGDFTGFSFNGIHSSSLNIIRVSDGDRYKEELQPELEDKTVTIPGNDGEYYYWSTYGTRTHTIDIAFDSVTEEQFRRIRRLFGTKKICELIYDERPYKVYLAKLTQPIELNYICFDEEEWYWESENHDHYIPGSIDHKIYTGKKRRIYKGEGTIELVSYFPFARTLYKTLEEYRQYYSGLDTSAADDKIDEWANSSGILTQEAYATNKIDQVVANNDSSIYNWKIPVYNPGDFNVGFNLYIPFKKNGKISPIDGQKYIRINVDSECLYLNEIERRNEKDTGILINARNHLIEGVTYSYLDDDNRKPNRRSPAWQTTGSLYNDAIVKGDFPYIKRNDWGMDEFDLSQGVYLSGLFGGDSRDSAAVGVGVVGEAAVGNTASTDSETSTEPNIVIHYDYIYF